MCRIWWGGGLNLEIRKQGAIKEIWAEPDCVRVGWFTWCLPATFPQEGCILPNPQSSVTEDNTWEFHAFHSKKKKQALHGFTNGLFWSFIGVISSGGFCGIFQNVQKATKNQVQTRSFKPDSSWTNAVTQSHSMTFHSSCDEARESKCPVSPIHFISQTSWCKKWRLSEWSFTSAHFLLNDGCRRFLNETGEVMRRGRTLFSSDFPA